MTQDFTPETKMSRADYVAMKIKGIKETRGIDVNERAVDWAKPLYGLETFTPGQLAAANFDYDAALAKDAALEGRGGLEGYVKRRQFAEMKGFVERMEMRKQQKHAATP